MFPFSSTEVSKSSKFVRFVVVVVVVDVDVVVVKISVCISTKFGFHEL